MTDLGWYLRRLSRMGPAEIAWRTRAVCRVHRWRRRLHDPTLTGAPLPGRRFTAVLPEGALARVPAAGVARLLDTADSLMDGRGEYFGVWRTDLADPDWSYDPRTGRRAPAEAYAFDVPYRDEHAVGDVKQLWEPSRHQHLTVLAGAYALTGDDRYAQRVADHLKSWWSANPPLRGVHWVSGIELAIRLISWVWLRRLLDGWPGASGLFEGNPEALHQVWHHQRWLAAFGSRGSSANNHVIAEAAGRFVAACAFDWFPESTRWRTDALRLLDAHLERNTFGSGLNRELATEYHGLVLELGLVAVAEAEAAGVAAPDRIWRTLGAMTDALAAIVDGTLRPPRQGDGDDGQGLILDGAGTDRWASLLATGRTVFGPLGWWPSVAPDDVRTALLTALIGPRPTHAGRPARRPGHFADAGLTVLRAPARGGRGEIWCRCDGGPHGFGSIAAHAHADALSIELRVDGVDLLADPGTYCYHGQPDWRRYFRSTLGHNTLELDGVDQSRSGGPFLWTRHARCRVLDVQPSRWRAEHSGYPGAVHRRTVALDPASGELRLLDEVLADTPRPCRLGFHLGPTVTARLDGNLARLRWPHAGRHRTATLVLPERLSWTARSGEVDPPAGWYSPSFGRRLPATTLIGAGVAAPGARLRTDLRWGWA